jgi:hypothetical protein
MPRAPREESYTIASSSDADHLCPTLALARQYNELTAPGGHIDFLSPERQPEQLGILIPLDYEGKALPLWRFRLQSVSENEV